MIFRTILQHLELDDIRKTIGGVIVFLILIVMVSSLAITVVDTTLVMVSTYIVIVHSAFTESLTTGIVVLCTLFLPLGLGLMSE